MLHKSVNILNFSSKSSAGDTAYFCSSVYVFIRVITGLCEFAGLFGGIFKSRKADRLLIGRYYSTTHRSFRLA